MSRKSSSAPSGWSSRRRAADPERRPTARARWRDRDVVPVTLALDPQDALAVTYADAFAVSVRLVGLPPGIESQDRADESDRVDPLLGIPLGGAAR